MKIQRVEIHNLKAIKDMDVVLDGNHILITGENGKGKSSFLQAIYTALGIKSEAPPVTYGETEGEVTVWTEEGHEFHTEVDHIKGVTKVSVKLPGEKLRDTKVSSVGAVVGGDILFDPHEFVELSKTEKGRKEQVERVKAMLDPETREALAKLERQIKANEEGRTETGRELKRMKGAVEQKGITQQDIQVYKEEINVQEKIAKQKEINTHNLQIKSVRDKYESEREEFDKLALKLEGLKKSISNAEVFLSENTERDTKLIEQEIATASSHNAMVIKVREYKKEFDQLQKLESEYGEAGSLIDSQREAYRRTVRSLELPIPDLTFEDERLMYKDRPVDLNVMSASEVMQLGVMLQIAKNPNVRVMVVPRCESLGRKKLEEIIEMCDIYDYQFIGEKVVIDQEELKIEFLVERNKK